MHEIAVKSLPEPCQPRLLSYCPTMDLVATVTTSKQQQPNSILVVEVWRLNGQRVFGILCDTTKEDQNQAQGDTVQISAINAAVAWRDDGRMLAIATSESSGIMLRLVDCFSGKVVKRTLLSTATATAEASKLSKPVRRLPLSWTTHFANSSLIKRHLNDFSNPNSRTGEDKVIHQKNAVSVDDLLGLNADIGKLLTVKADLPAELAAIDMETSLPKLATLPATGGDDDVFSTRNSIDAIFHSENDHVSGIGGSRSKTNTTGGSVDALLVSSLRDCFLHLCIFDSFEIGQIDVSTSLSKGLKGRQILNCASHPLLTTCFLVLEAEPDTEIQSHRSSGIRESTINETSKPSIQIISLNLRFINQTSQNLPLFARKATQLQNLLRYLFQIQGHLAHETKAAFDLPMKFLRNINESLAEQDKDSNFMTAAYHLIVTGECLPRFKEWLVDEVGDRGLKRWEKAVGDCLDTFRRMVSECFLPALERCHVVLSRLDGLSKFSETSTKLGLDQKGIMAMRETLDVLNILGEDLLRDVCIEIKEFNAFMRWIKWEAEVEALEEGSERAEELRENWTGESELRIVLGYVGEALQRSRVLKYMDVFSSIHGENSVRKPQEDDLSTYNDLQFYANFQTGRKKLKKNYKQPQIVNLLDRLKRQSDLVFSNSAKTLQQSMLTSHLASLPDDIDQGVMDVRVTFSRENSKRFEIVVLSRSVVDRSKLRIIRLNMSDEAGKTSKYLSTQINTLHCPDTETVTDVRFIDDKSFLILTTNSNQQGRLYWQNVSEPSQQLDSREAQHVFEIPPARGGGFRPACLEINGRKGRRVVTVVDDRGSVYVVLDLDTGVEEINTNEERQEGDDVMTE